MLCIAWRKILLWVSHCWVHPAAPHSQSCARYSFFPHSQPHPCPRNLDVPARPSMCQATGTRASYLARSGMQACAGGGKPHGAGGWVLPLCCRHAASSVLLLSWSGKGHLEMGVSCLWKRWLLLEPEVMASYLPGASFRSVVLGL